jgi:diguanylate cyclase (GGDEF)-like protein
VMVTGMWLTSRPSTIRTILPDGDALSYELASLALGLAVAEMVLHAPWLVPVMVAPVAYIHRSSMIKTLREAARTDSKTGLLNTAAWTEHARAALARCARSGRAAAVVIIDVDHFKAINDARGHAAGDAVLVALARAWEDAVRRGDVLARLGGDEFGLLLPAAGLEEAMEVLERLRAATPATPCSVGLVRWDGEEAPAALVARGDGLLYEAKALGRDRVRVQDTPLGLAA